MSQRLDSPYGLFIDRNHSLTFRVDGRSYQGYQGDTLASALLGAGHWTLGHGHWYRRPTGVFHLDDADLHCRMRLDDGATLPAPAIPLREGLGVQRLGNPPSWWQRLLSRFRPPPALPFWERGAPATASRARTTDSEIHHADVAVIGGGAAGMVAALAAAETGRRVVLVERERQLGGALHYSRFDAEGERGKLLAGELLAQLDGSDVQILTDTACMGRRDQALLLQGRDRSGIQLIAPRVVLATGALGLSAVFRHNDLPGIVHGAAAQRLIHLYGVRPGQQAVVLTANGEGYGVALDLLDAGVTVTALVDLNPEPPDDIRALSLDGTEVEILHGWLPVTARARGDRLSALEISDAAGNRRRLDCDLLCVEVGAQPRTELIRQHGGSLVYDEQQRNLVLESLPEPVLAVGALKGTWDLDTVLLEARFAGWSAAGRQASMVLPQAWQQPINHPWPVYFHQQGMELVDLADELSIQDLQRAARAEPEPTRLLDRLSSPDLLNSLRLLCQDTDTALPGFRLPPLASPEFAAPVTETDEIPVADTDTAAPTGAVVDDPIDPTPELAPPAVDTTLSSGPVDAAVAEATASTAVATAAPPDTASSLAEEVRAVRERVGLISLDFLGGLEIRGADAARLLASSYRFASERQAVGTVRHVILTDIDGTPVDDGLLGRFAREFFYLSTHRHHHATVRQRLQSEQARADLAVEIHDVSDSLIRLEVAGPRGRELLAPLCEGVELGPEGLPFLGARRATVAGIPVRLLRGGYVGELSHEIHAPADQAETLRAALLGQADHLPGISHDARNLLGFEKGRVEIGNDTEGLVLTGQRAGRPRFQAADRPTCQLLSFAVENSDSVLPEPGQALLWNGETVGQVVRAALSPTLGRAIGMARVDLPGDSADVRLNLADDDTGALVQLSDAGFYDPHDRRQTR